MMKRRTDGAKKVSLPPLDLHEIPAGPDVPLDLPAECDTFTVPGEQMSREEREYIPGPVDLPPLHPSEIPVAVTEVFDAVCDPRLDDPEWGTAKHPPDLLMGQRRLLHPWDA